MKEGFVYLLGALLAFAMYQNYKDVQDEWKPEIKTEYMNDKDFLKIEGQQYFEIKQ